MRTPTPRACTAVVTLAFVAIATTGCADDPAATGVRAPGANAQVVLTITGAAGGRSYREETLVDSTTRRYRYRSCVGGIGEKNCTPAQLALSWVLAQGENIIPIPGTRREKYLRENMAALDVTLTADDLARINDALPVGAAAGTRYHETMMGRVNN